ncbi:MAG: hypothetical protein ABIF11_11075 [Nitrospirota bacterium]
MTVATREIVKEISQNMKVMWLGTSNLIRESSWKKLKGRLKVQEEIDVEKILDEKGIYETSKYL